jgi:hypothetical protein
MSAFAKHGIVVLLIGAVLLVSIAAAFAQEPLQPKIYIQKMRHDFGKTYEQETFEHTFIVKNRGQADLVIDNVKPG